MVSSIKKIIFVCTGNTCRSPMAEGLGKQCLDKGIHIISRGLSVHEGQGPNPSSVAAMLSEGIDIRAHRAKSFSPEDVTEDTLILGMTQNHVAYISALYPDFSKQTFTLLAYCGMKGDVADPYGQNQEVYNQCAKLLKEAIMKIEDRRTV